MIFIMSLKTWNKYKKKLVVPKDYMIIDGTEDANAKLSAFTNTVTMDHFNPPANLIKCLKRVKNGEKMDDILDYDRLEKLEENFLDGLRLHTAVMAAVSGLLQGDINLFLILRNGVFKHYKKAIRRAFLKRISVPFKYVYIFNNDDQPSDFSKELKYTFTEKEMSQLSDALDVQEKIMEKRSKKERKKRKY